MKKNLFLLVIALIYIQSVICREVIPLNSDWRFFYASENSADYARSISIPHVWNYGVNKIINPLQPTTVNYTRRIYAPTEWKDKRIFVKFYGVQGVTNIFINGKYLGEHRGGSTAFTFELTDKLILDDDNTIMVNVNNSVQSDILPTSYEQNIYSGIYRDVELIVTDKTNISPLYYGSDGVFVKPSTVNADEAEGVVAVHVDSKVTTVCRVNLNIYDQNGNSVYNKHIAKARIDGRAVDLPFKIKRPNLWSPSSPYLYSFKVTISAGEEEEMQDYVSVTSGFRSIELGENNTLKLNGEPLKINGVTLYHDSPAVGGTPLDEDIDRDMSFIKEIGANAMRSAVSPHSQYLYDLCDRNGTLVWIDLPLSRAPYLSDIDYYPTSRFQENGREQLREIIAQNYNHPSVAMWGLFSMLLQQDDAFTAYIKELNTIAKQMDSSRPTVALSNQNGAMNDVPDLIVWKQDLGWIKGSVSDVDVWSDLLHTKFSLMRSAVAYGENGRIDQQAVAKEYKTDNPYRQQSWFPEGRQREFHEEYAKRLLPDSLFWGTWITNMFDFKSSRATTGENNSGMVTYDRKSRKDVFYLYKALWNKNESTLYITDKRNKYLTDSVYSVKVYASDVTPPVVVYGDKTVVMKNVAPSQFVADSIILKKGLNQLVVEQGSLRDNIDLIFESPLGNKPSGRGLFGGIRP